MTYTNTDSPVSLLKTTRMAENYRSSVWQQLTAKSPSRWLFWGHDKVMLTPIKAGGFTEYFDTAKISYIEMPRLLAASTDTVDTRVPIKDQEFLKYAAAFYLLNMRTDKQFTDMAEYFMDKFHKLIGA